MQAHPAAQREESGALSGDICVAMADAIPAAQDVEEFRSFFHPTHMKQTLEVRPQEFKLLLDLCLIPVHPSFGAVCSTAYRNMDDSIGASPILIRYLIINGLQHKLWVKNASGPPSALLGVWHYCSPRQAALLFLCPEP